MALTVRARAQGQDTPPTDPPAPPPDAESPTPPAPAPAAPAGPAAPPAGSGRVTLLMIGDSLAQGLGLYFQTMQRQVPNLRVANEAIHSTGFTRYQQLHWGTHADTVVARNAANAVVVWMGLNDFRHITDLDSERRYRFETPAWAERYAQRIDDLLGRLRRANLPVFWLGLPILREAQSNQSAQVINAVQRPRVEAAGETWIDAYQITAGADGAFRAFLPDPPQGERRFRAEDGIHFTPFGYRFIMMNLLRRVATRLPALAPAVTVR